MDLEEGERRECEGEEMSGRKGGEVTASPQIQQNAKSW